MQKLNQQFTIDFDMLILETYNQFNKFINCNLATKHK
jgi:hypothetical protein